MPSASMRRGARRPGATGFICSASTSAPSRRVRRARNEADARSNVTRRGPRSRSAKRASISSSVIGAASTMRLAAAAPVSSATARNGSRASDEAGSRLPPRPLASRKPRRRRRRGSSRCGRDRRARASDAGGRLRLRLLPPAHLRPPPSPSRAHLRRGANGRGGNCRGGARRSTSSPPSPRSVRIAAMLGGVLARALRAGIDHHARQPRRQRQRAQLAAFLGDAAFARRWRPARSSSACASLSAARGGGSRKARLARVGAPHCARSSTKDDRSADKISGRV